MCNLKTLRQKRKMTQQDIANKLGITQATYNGYEKGKHQPSIDMLKKIAEIFDTSIDIIVDRYKI